MLETLPGTELAQRAWTAVLGLGRGFGTLINVGGYLVLTPVLMFYLLRDFDLIVARAGELVPGQSSRPAANSFARNYDKLLSSYLRGQVLTSVIVGAHHLGGASDRGVPVRVPAGRDWWPSSGWSPIWGVVVSLIPALHHPRADQ